MSIGLIVLILFLVCLCACAVGFKKFVWFLSIGYGFAIAASGIALAAIYLIKGTLNITGLIASIIFVIYGLRLGLFLLIRELKNASYRKTLDAATKTEHPIPIFVSIFVWIFVSILYVCEISGVVFSLENIAHNAFFQANVLEILGIIIMASGVLIESLSDKQKSASKKVNPNLPAMKGLFKFCRCPNYFGEILTWTGAFVYSFSVLLVQTNNRWWQWVMIAFGYICIIYIMLNGAKRLEKRQEQNYKGNPEFEAYIAKTPIIFVLFVPIKSLKNSKVIK